MITPTTAELKQQIITNLESSLSQTIPLLPLAFIRILANVFAGVFIILYKYAGFIFLQIFISTASFEETEINGRIVRPLVEWGRLFRVDDPQAATQAELEVEVVVEVQSGSLPAGTPLFYGSTGVTYITVGAVLLDAATVTATIRAVNDQSGNNGAGSIGNLDEDTVLTFANPLSNVNRNVTVTAQTVTGADAETEDHYRQRVTDAARRQPQGGSSSDYEIWGEGVAGIANVYPYTGDPGEVDVYVEATPESSGDPDGIPTAAQLEAVYDAIQLNDSGLASRRPLGSFINVLPITRTGFDVIVSGLSVDNEAAVQADIETVITNFFLTAAPFVDGLTTPPRKDIITRSSLVSAIEFVVSQANGTFTEAVFMPTGEIDDLDSYILSEGEKAKVVDITFV